MDEHGTRPASWEGGCLCGACRFEFELDGEAPYAGYCHCDMCKRATGGPFAVLVQCPLAALRWTKGHPSTFRSSPIATRGFCPVCGTPLFLQYDNDALVRLTAGSFDHPGRLRPRGHYGVESRLTWADIGPGLPEEETQERF